MLYPINKFQKISGECPNLTALCHDKSETSYRTLKKLADAISAALYEHGIRSGDRVILGMEPGADLIAAMIGIMQLGAAYVPIDLNAPTARNKLIVQDCEPKCALLETTKAEIIDGRCPTINIDNLSSKSSPPWTRIHADTIAYVIYTSGSTGRPKGVPISHGNMAALFGATEMAFAFGPSDTGVLYHSYAFDFSVWEIWSMLAYGGCLCIPSYLQKISAKEFTKFLSDNRVTILNQTPTSFSLNASEIMLLGFEASTLRAVVFGGERLNLTLLKPWVREFPLDQVSMINMYGITETTIHSSYHRITPRDLDSTDSVIGHMLDGFDARIWPVDGLPEGRSGELFLSGPQVTAGYLNRPDLSDERFIKIDNKCFFRSGDLVSQDASGRFIYQGRLDDQLSINGHRVETGEIEAVLLQSGISDFCILSQDTELGQILICVFVAPTKADDIVKQHMRSTLRQTANTGLPIYMRPNKYVSVAEIKRTANGKVDKQDLRNRM